MTTKRRRRFTADFKKRVALKALRGDRTVQAIAAKHEVHPNQVGTWKRQAIEGLDEVFARGGSPGPSEHEATIRDLHAKIGELPERRRSRDRRPVPDPDAGAQPGRAHGAAGDRPHAAHPRHLRATCDHAATASCRVELTQLKYLLPRLAQRAEVSLSRLAGGIGGRGDPARRSSRSTAGVPGIA